MYGLLGDNVKWTEWKIQLQNVYCKPIQNNTDVHISDACYISKEDSFNTNVENGLKTVLF